MKTLVDGNTVIINDEVSIAYSDGVYKVRDFPVPGLELQVPQPQTTTYTPPPRDPVYYDNGHNGLTIAESARRAAQKIDVDFDQYGDQMSDYDDVVAACTSLIEQGQGRNGCYRIAGGITRGRKDGLYRGLPLSLVFKAYVDGKIDVEEDDSKVPGISNNAWSSFAIQTPYRGR